MGKLKHENMTNRFLYNAKNDVGSKMSSNGKTNQTGSDRAGSKRQISRAECQKTSVPNCLMLGGGGCLMLGTGWLFSYFVR